MCTEASLSDGYVTVTHRLPDGSTYEAYGGNQNDFFTDDAHSPMSDRIIRNGGCALIALCDCSLYLSKRLRIDDTDYLAYVRDFSQKHLSPISAVAMIRKFTPKFLISDDKVMEFARKITKGTYTLGIFYFKLCNAFNKIYRSQGLRMRSMFLNSLSVFKIKRALFASLADNIPAVLLLDYGSQATAAADENGTAKTYKIGWHFMTVTGIRCESDTRTVIVLSSWGKRMEAVLEDLSRDSGLMGSVMLIKKVNKGAH